MKIRSTLLRRTVRQDKLGIFAVLHFGTRGTHVSKQDVQNTTIHTADEEFKPVFVKLSVEDYFTFAKD